MGFIKAIETAVPDFGYSQEELRDFYLASTSDAKHKRKIKLVAQKSGIQSRYSVLKDFSGSHVDFVFLNQSSSFLPEPSLTQRMQIYQRAALPLAIKAVCKIRQFEKIKDSITDLITVTCTGLFAPGLDIELMRHLGLKQSINRSSVNFMGCNAAVLALKQADAICNSRPNAHVLVVCVELCTLHFQKRYNDDYILSNLIFSDGAAAVLLSSQTDLEKESPTLKINSFQSLVIHNGIKDMAWQLSETGFIMNLSSYVPQLIKENIKPLLESLNLNVAEINFWAIHPGGKRILDDFCSALELNPIKLAESYDILKNYGNMSSPTVLFVLKRIMESCSNVKNEERIFLAAFGPGISIETMQLENV